MIAGDVMAAGAPAVAGVRDADSVSTSPLSVGRDTFPGEFLPGLIDNLRTYNRALSAVEIAQDMNTPVTP